MFVFGSGLSKGRLEELGHWDNVIYQELEQAFPWSTDAILLQSAFPPKPRIQYYEKDIDGHNVSNALHIRYSLMARLVRMFGHAGYIQLGWVFSANYFAEMAEQLIPIDGHFRVFDSQTKDPLGPIFEMYVDENSPSFRLYVHGRIGILQVKLASEKTYQQQSFGPEKFGLSRKRMQKYMDSLACHIKLLPEAIHSYRYYAPIDATLDKATETPNLAKRPCVSFGVLCTSKGVSSVRHLPLTKIFIPTLLASLTNQDYFEHQFIVYVGYDDGDKLFDQAHSRFRIRRQVFCHLQADAVKRNKGSRVKSAIKIRWIKFSYSGAAVTHLWNVLFRIAMEKDKSDYFFQANDDLLFERPLITAADGGWIKKWIEDFDSTDGYGVLGPNDLVFNCSSLTQIMVHRRHFDLFGFLFPPEFRNWHSDTWLSRIYGPELSRCRREVRVRNRRPGPGGFYPRYLPCKQIDYLSLISHYSLYIHHLKQTMSSKSGMKL